MDLAALDIERYQFKKDKDSQIVNDWRLQPEDRRQWNGDVVERPGQITARTHDETHLLPIPVMDGPTPPWLPALVEVIAGQRLDEDDIYQRVFESDFFELKTLITQISAKDEATPWVDWFLADRATRPAYPNKR